MRAYVARRAIVFGLISLGLLASLGSGQDQPQGTPAGPPAPPPVPAAPLAIPDEPRAIDPATVMPEMLAASVTVNFTEASLREIGQWIQEQRKLPVLFDQRALTEEGVTLGEPVTDRLNDEPLYLLLNRLKSLGLAWYVQEGILHVTTETAAADRMTTQPYTVGDLLDAGYEGTALIDTIETATEGPWSDVDGVGGGVQLLGDVLFVRQTDYVQRRVAGLLAALRRHGRQTFILDPPQHLALRRKLDENVSVNFQDMPLFRAVEELARIAQADIRLDMPALREERIRDREPVSLVLPDRKLGTVLHVLLADLGLTWTLRDGVLWVTSRTRAEDSFRSAVYDVRDLTRDAGEAAALTDAIANQTSGPWMSVDGTGGEIVFPRTGTMVVRHTEQVLGEVLALLETYRTALLTSKPRRRDRIDPQEVVTRYYRVYEKTADDLARLLPELVQVESWKNERHPDGLGTILKGASPPELSGTPAVVIPRAVLIVKQTRAAHDEIAEVIQRFETGDPRDVHAGGVGGLGGLGGGLGGVAGGIGGGGFGSGFFSTDNDLPQARRKARTTEK
ncbi:MAG: hypothetical protein WD069_19050 [Planctomycetales bacterium]